MDIKIKHLFITLCLGIGLVLFLLQTVAFLPAKAQEDPCNGIYQTDGAAPSCQKADNDSATNSPTNWFRQTLTAEKTRQPDIVLADAYQRVLDAGAYDFTAESEQTLLPRPLPEMIGQTDQRLDMHLEGEVTLPDKALLRLSVDGLGLDPTPISVLQEGGNSYYLQDGEKIPFDNPLGIASPGGDYLSYLAAAENVLPCETDDAPFDTAVSCYTYDINGQRYAEHVRDQLQAQLASGPQAPPSGIEYEMSPSPILMGMSGTGKVWLDENDLPLRQAVNMHLPEMNDYYDVDVRLVVDYHFDAVAITAVTAAQSPITFLSIPLPSPETIVNQVEESLPNITILACAFAIAVLLFMLRRRRWMYSFFAISLSALLILTPLLEILNYGRYDRRVAHAAESTITLADVVETSISEASVDATANAAPATTAAATTTQPYEPDIYCGIGDNSDRDGDGLADDAEYCLGTDANEYDTDHDGISDGDEVAGFTYDEKTWYSDPLNPDSNLDGVQDGAEWIKAYDGFAAAWDLDSDGLPNLWDDDDDGDGIGDKRDLSPASFTDYVLEPRYGAQPITNTFNFNVTGQFDGYIYVEMQVQPENLEHLRYGVTPLDWGFDNRGQIQDLNGSTDDIQLIPMLSVKSNAVPNSDLQDQYNVTVMQDTDTDGYREMLVPLSLVGDAGMSEAFALRMTYGPDTLANLGQAGIRWRNAKIVWIVQGKLDSENSNNDIIEKKQPVHMYAEAAMRVAGWQVTKSGQFNSAVLGTPDMPKDDRQLFQLLFGLSGSYLNYPEITLSEIAARFSGANTPIEEKWGVTTTVKIDSPVTPYSHYDEGVSDLSNRIKSFLTNNYAMNDPAVVIIASESKMGVYGLDDAGGLQPSINQLGVNLNEVFLVESRSLELHMRDGWKAVSNDDFDLAVIERNADYFKSSKVDLQDQYPAITEEQLASLTVAFYMIWQNGRTHIMSVDGIVGESTAVLSDAALYQRYSLAPLDKFGDPLNASALPGYLVEAGNFAQEGAGLIIESSAQIYQYLQSHVFESIEMGFNAATGAFVAKMEEGLNTIEHAFDKDVMYANAKWLVKTEWFGKSKTLFINATTYVDVAYDTSKLVGKALSKGKSVLSKLTKTANKLSKVSKVGIALLILDVAMQVTMFILKGDFSSAAIAGLLASIILSVMLFVIALNPVGAIIVAIVGVIDLILTLIGLEEYAISGYVTKFMALAFYSSAALTRLKSDSIAFVDRQTSLADENMGYVVGNRYEVSDQFKAMIELARSDWSDDFSFTRLKQEVAHWGGISGKYLGQSWVCGEFTIAGWPTMIASTTTCPSPLTSYDPNNPPNKESVGYINPLTAQIYFDTSGANLPLAINTKVTAKTYNLNGGIINLFKKGSIMSYDPFTLKLPDDMKEEDRKDWKPQTIYLDVLPATIDEFWAWSTTPNGVILTNYDPDGDGITNKDEINARLGSKAYAILQDDLGSAAGSMGFRNVDQLLMAWETEIQGSTVEAQLAAANLCPTEAGWPNLCDTNTTAFWLDIDSDGDGLSDKFEYDNYGKIGANLAKYDTDGDGLSDGFEYKVGTSINAKDTDGDGLTDDLEVYHPTQNGTWTGGYLIQLPKYGAVGSNGRFMMDVRVIPDPRSQDSDSDGLKDAAEKTSGTSPAAFNRVPRVALSGQPWAVSPTGQGAVYVAAGERVTLTSSLDIFPPFTVSGTLSLALPGNILNYVVTSDMSGSRTVPNTGVTMKPKWDFATKVLQSWDSVSATSKGWSISSLSYSQAGTATLSLPFGANNSVQLASVPIVVDADNPNFDLLTPAHGALIGGGVSHYVIGGSSGDQTTWVDRIDLTLPGMGAQTITHSQTLSPWAFTWELPGDGIYTVSGRSHDYVGHNSNQDAVQVMIDNTPPTVTVNLTDGAVYGPPQDSDVITITLSGGASENYSGLARVQISTDGGPWREVWTQETATVTNTAYTDFGAPFYQRATGATWDAEWTLPNVESVQGYHSLRVRAFDQAGNWPSYLERTIIIDVLPPTDDLVNRAYLNEYPHVPANEIHTFSGVANDVGNVPQPSRPVELAGALDSINDATIWLGMADINENNAGVNAAWIGDFNGDRRGDLLVGLPAAAGGAGQVAVVYGRAGDWPIPNEQEMLADSRTSFIGLPGAGIGLQAEAAGDVNGDGLADFLIGDPVNNRVYLILGSPKYLGGGLHLDGPQGVNIRALQVPAGQQIGHNLGAAGDVNGDGYADLLIGVTGSLDAAYLLLGQPSPIWETDDIAQHAAARIMGAGTAVLAGLGDLDGDFHSEFAVSVNNTLYLFAGKGSYAPRAGIVLYPASNADAAFNSADALPAAAALGDVNGDHLDDFIYSDGGGQYLVFGDAALSDGSWVTASYNLGVGFLAAPGDVDNDGLNDILIGGGDDAYLILGSDTGTVQAAISGVANAASAPYAAGADLNSDGSSDLLLVPTAASAQAAATTSDSAIDLPPTWVPRLPKQTLDTFVGNPTWPPVPGADAYVNGDGVCHGLTPCYTTIQAAVNARFSGDLIIVQPGAYGSFVVNGKNNMTVQGTNPDAVFVDANGGSYAAQISNATGVQLKNMTLRNASYGVQLDDAGINGHEVMSNRTILDHLLIYDVGAYDVYMTRSSAVSVTNSTLVRSANHIGVYGPADPNISVQWNAMPNAPWPIWDGGGAVAIGDKVYVAMGGGQSGFARYDASIDQWMSNPWGPNNRYEANSAIAAGSDKQVYLLGAPTWKNVDTPISIFAKFAEAPNGDVYASDAQKWDGSSWSAVPGVDGTSCYNFAVDQNSGDLYCLGYGGGLQKWDGSSWTMLSTDPVYGVEAMAVASDGKVYIGGSFTLNRTNGPSCENLAYYDYSWGCESGFETAVEITDLAADPNSSTVYVGGEFSAQYLHNVAAVNGGQIYGVSGPVYGVDVGQDGAVYVSGDFTSTLDYGGAVDQAAPASIASFKSGSWTTYPEVVSNTVFAWGYDVAVTDGGDLYAVGLWTDSGNTKTENFIHWNGTDWERVALHANASNNSVIRTVESTAHGLFFNGDFDQVGLPGQMVSMSDIGLLQFPHEVYSPTLNAWTSALTAAPVSLRDGASYAGDNNGHLILLPGGGRTDSFKYDIATDSWSRTGDMPDPVNASAMTIGQNGDVYAVTDGSSSLYRFNGSWWTAVGPAVSGVTIDDGVAIAYDPHLENYYVLPGGNSTKMLRYSNGSWETLPVDRDTPAGVRPGAALALVEGADENKLYTPQGNYIAGPSPSSALWMYPLPQPNKVSFENTAIYAQTASSWLNLSDPLPEDFNFRIGAGTLFFGGSGWTPTNKGTLPTTTATPFLDPSHDLYRMGQPGYTVGYHTYTAPVTATTAAGIQAAINSGANRVVVEPGIYEEDVYLMNGVELIGANPDWTIIRPLSGSAANALIRSAGATGASVSRFTLEGEASGLDGLAVTGNAAHVKLERTLIYETDTAIAIDGAGSDLEVAHVTVAENTNGLAATNCASVDVRNSIFAYHTGSGLSHEGCAVVKLHTYNLYWANASDFGGAADAGAAELFLDPNFVDALDHDYRTYNYSPVIDAGNPTDPAPPGAGSRADIGYVEQGRVNFYVDDSYCNICVNDGLTWQVDAFDTIQAALDAAKNALLNLNPGDVDVPQLVVGVAPGTYAEQVTLPSHVLLMGSGAETTILDGGGSTAVTINGVTNAGVRDLTLTNANTAVLVNGSSNTIDLRHNIFDNNTTGLLVNGRGTAYLEHNTFVNNAIGVQADSPGSWAVVMHNIVSGSNTGASAANNGQIYSDFNLYFNTVDFSGAAQGNDDLVGQDPLFTGGQTPYRLSETSPALDAASPTAPVPNGGGARADLGYSELLAAPITLLLGQEDLSTAMGNAGVASVEYGVVTVADPTTAVTDTLPAAWTPITLDTPGETYSYWTADYTPLEEGLQRFYSRATDMVGNQEDNQLDWYDGSFVVDSTPPVVQWLLPSNGASLQSPLELRAQVSDYAAGEFSVEEKDVYFEIGGQRYPATWAAEPWDEAVGAPRVFRAWVDLATGAYNGVTAVAEDKAGNATTDTLSFTVTGSTAADTVAPALTVVTPVDGSWVTRTVQFTGSTADSGSGVASVEVSVDGGSTWRPATVSGGAWSLTWDGPEDEPFVSYPAQVRAADRAGNVTAQPLQFTIDEAAPTGLLPVTFNFDEDSHFDTAVSLTINWQPPIDSSGVVTALLAVDQITNTIPTNVVTGTTAVANLNANGEWYVHLMATDAAGNAILHRFGPWHVGINEGLAFAQRQQSIIIDGYVDVDAGEWKLDTEFLDNDERTIGSPVSYSPGGQQTFLTAWDSDNYFMAWRGAQWTLDGELWVYINSGAGGGNQLIQPLADAPGATLPFGADYAVQITDPLTGTLWEYAGGWQVSSLDWAFAQGSLGDTEIRLPLFGTSNVEALAFGLGDDLKVWAIFPASNPLNPANGGGAPQALSAAAGLGVPMVVNPGGWRSYHWDDITIVTDVAANQPQAAGLELSMASNPTPMVMPGPDSVIEYVVRLTNHEAYTMTGKQIAFIAIPFDSSQHESIVGATCATTNPWQCILDPLPPGDSVVTLTLRLASDLNSVEQLSMFTMLQDSDIPPEFNTQSDIRHLVDSLPPEVTLLSDPYATLGAQTFTGTADDGNGIGVDYVEVRPAGGSWQRVDGTSFWTADLTVSPFSQHGDVWQFEVRAVDKYGQIGPAQPVSFTVDLQPPVIALDTTAGFNQAFNDVTGIVTDSPSGSEISQVRVQIDSEPWRDANVFAPNETGEQAFLWVWNAPAEDGVSHTLRVEAVDLIGNVGGLVEPQTIWVDNVNPVLTVTQALTQVVVQDYRPGAGVGGPVISGQASDGGGLAQAQVFVELPDGQSYRETAVLAGNLWHYTPVLEQVGDYRLRVEVQDLLGNTTVSEYFALTVIAAPDSSTNWFYTAEDTPFDFEPLLNDLDLDGDVLSVAAVGDPAHGTAIISPTTRIVYTPTLNFNGTDVFTYTASDGSLTDTATVTITVTPVNDPPVISGSSTVNRIIGEDSGSVALNFNANDVDGDLLAWDITGGTDTAVITKTYGSGNSDIDLSYTPLPDFAGLDTFAVQVGDGQLTDTVTVNVMVVPADDAPRAAADYVVLVPGDSGAPLQINVLANDTEVDGQTLSLIELGDPSLTGTVQISGTMAVYTPTLSVGETETITYTVSDGGLTDTAVIQAMMVAGDVSGEPDETVTLPGVGSDDTMTVTLSIPPDAAGDDAFTLVVRETAVPTQSPGGYKFAGLTLSLDAYINGVLTTPFTPTTLITISVTYSDADFADILGGEDSLTLWYWTGSEWSEAGITLVERDLADNRLVFSITHLSEFALFGWDGYRVYLPVVIR